MKIDDWFKMIIILLCGTLIIHQIIQDTQINQRPTCAEVQSMIGGNTTSIFHINNAGKLQSCLYTLILIELNGIEGLELRQRLESHVKWMVAMEELRSKEERDKLEEAR